jgi:hypothetical protein
MLWVLVIDLDTLENIFYIDFKHSMNKMRIKIGLNDQHNYFKGRTLKHNYKLIKIKK